LEKTEKIISGGDVYLAPESRGHRIFYSTLRSQESLSSPL